MAAFVQIGARRKSYGIHYNPLKKLLTWNYTKITDLQKKELKDW